VWTECKEIARLLKDERLRLWLAADTYAEVKEKPAELRRRRRVKEAVTVGLEGWVGNRGDGEWTL